MSCGWRCFGVELRIGLKVEVEVRSWSPLGSLRAALRDTGKLRNYETSIALHAMRNRLRIVTTNKRIDTVEI